MVGAAPHETPAGKSEEYVSPPAPVTTAPVPLASLRRVAELVAGRKRKVPGTAVSGGVGGVKAALHRSGSGGSGEQHANPVAPCHARVHGGALHDAEVSDGAWPREPIPKVANGQDSRGRAYSARSGNLPLTRPVNEERESRSGAGHRVVMALKPRPTRQLR